MSGSEARNIYLIGLGSNMRHHRYGAPRGVVAAAIEIVAQLGKALAVSSIVSSDPLGPSLRQYANAAMVLECNLAPELLLERLKRIEFADFGRRAGQRWGQRPLDLDIVLFSGGMWVSPQLSIPHPHFRDRGFVLGPASAIAPEWRDPLTALSLKQLNARLTKPRPIPR